MFHKEGYKIISIAGLITVILILVADKFIEEPLVSKMTQLLF